MKKFQNSQNIMNASYVYQTIKNKVKSVTEIYSKNMIEFTKTRFK